VLAEVEINTDSRLLSPTSWQHRQFTVTQWLHCHLYSGTTQRVCTQSIPPSVGKHTTDRRSITLWNNAQNTEELLIYYYRSRIVFGGKILSQVLISDNTFISIPQFSDKYFRLPTKLSISCRMSGHNDPELDFYSWARYLLQQIQIFVF
jgi:hypothetical protein